VLALRKGTHEGYPYLPWFGGNAHRGDGKPSLAAKGHADVGVKRTSGTAESRVFGLTMRVYPLAVGIHTAKGVS
jgi:hypothetical protein